MTQRVVVRRGNRRFIETHGPMYFDDVTRKEAKRLALAMIADDLANQRAMAREALYREACNTYVSVVSMQTSRSA